MSVKKKDRHVSKQECLIQSRYLMNYILILVRPPEYRKKDGKLLRKAGLLGQGQPFQVFGLDIVKYGKMIHANCYQASRINIKNEASLASRNRLHQMASEYCDNLFQEIDLCIFQYAQNSKKKRRSFEHLARLTYTVKQSILDRMNRDKLIYEDKYASPQTFKRGR